jgi:PIN domain nuclease of toxin-antitoxin system
MLRDRRHACLLSVVSVWELLVKHRKGKIAIESGDQTVFEFLIRQSDALGLESLDIAVRDVAHVERLATLHHDPFDRLLICQAIEQGLALVTPDPAIRQYPIRTFW